MTTTIRIDEDTREDLKKFGNKGETYDQIIHHLMDIAEQQTFYEKQRRILKNEEFTPLDDI